MQNILTNWKTTMLGTGAILTAAGHLLSHIGVGDTSVLATDLPALLAGFGLIFGKDAAAK